MANLTAPNFAPLRRRELASASNFPAIRSERLCMNRSGAKKFIHDYAVSARLAASDNHLPQPVRADVTAPRLSRLITRHRLDSACSKPHPPLRLALRITTDTSGRVELTPRANHRGEHQVIDLAAQRTLVWPPPLDIQAPPATLKAPSGTPLFNWVVSCG
jgi:hypothetical protein